MKKLKMILTGKRGWIIIFLITAFLVFGMPIIINETYKAKKGYMTFWGALCVRLVVV